MQHSNVIKKIQTALNISQTGFLDEPTKAAIRNFQMTAGVKATGLIDDDTLDKLSTRTSFVNDGQETDQSAIGTYDSDPYTELYDNEAYADFSFSSDLFESNSAGVKPYHLDQGQYVDEITNKKMIFLHHTAGWENPYKTIKWWNNDQRGRVGTEYVIGGINFRTDNKKYDGTILRAFPEGNWIYHLGGYKRHGITPEMVKESIGIEICNFGWLTEKFGKYYTYTGTEVPEKYVTKLDKPFRGYEYWHSYSDAQIKALEKLLRYLSYTYHIDLTRGLREELIMTYDKHTAFEYNEDFMRYPKPGIWSHTTVRKDKTDVYPHPKLISMLEKLHY